MKKLRTVPGLFSTWVTLMFLVLVTSTALADQITLTYIDAGSNPQVLKIDINSSAEDLALAVSLLGEVGVGLVHDTNNGSGTLAEIAAAMATVAPLFAARIAQILVLLSPDDKAAIVAAVLAVPGVDTDAVLAAVQSTGSVSVVSPGVIPIENLGSDN